MEPSIPRASTTESAKVGRLPQTEWSMILEAGRGSQPSARAALGRLYENYRPALLGFLRHQGHSQDQAEEFVQSFFAQLLSRGALAQVKPMGRFRTWLLTCLRHHVRDRWAHDNAAKRRPSGAVVPIGGSQDTQCVQPAGRELAADREFDRQYAIAFLNTVMTALESDYVRRGRTGLFAALLPFLHTRNPDESHAEVAAALGMTANSVGQEVCRMKKRYRELFRVELEKLCGPRDLEEERRHLLAALSR